jgi:hypothetical protein
MATTTDALFALTEECRRVNPDISIGQTALTLSKIIDYLDYQPVAEPSQNFDPISHSDSIKALSQMILNVNTGLSVEESIKTVLNFTYIENQSENLNTSIEANFETTNNIELKEIKDIPLEQSEITWADIELMNDRETQLNNSQTQNDIHQYVIPLMLQRLSLMGEKDENNIQVYQSEKFTAQLETPSSGTYILILDRNKPLEMENKQALLATKAPNELRFEIVINALSESEIETFKYIYSIEQVTDIAHPLPQPEID